MINKIMLWWCIGRLHAANEDLQQAKRSLEYCRAEVSKGKSTAEDYVNTYRELKTINWVEAAKKRVQKWQWRVIYWWNR